MALRNVSRRDAIILLLGASFFYTFSAFVSPSPPIIVSTHPQSPSAGQTVTETVFITAVSPKPTQAAPEVVPLDLGLQNKFPETTVIAHAPGWTISRNLYSANGTLLLLTSDPSQFPAFRLMTSTGLPGNLTNDAQRMPTSREMAFITPADAEARWGGGMSLTGRNRVATVEGTTLLFNDPPQFLNHYFHFVAELIYGSWAFLYGAFSDQPVKPLVSVPEPSFNPPFISNSTPKIDRAIFIHADVKGWRDAPGFNGYFMRAVFPSMTIEVATDWVDRMNATASTEIGRAWHFPLVLLTDRSAAFRGAICGHYTQRTAAEAWMTMAKLEKIDLIGNWWASMRAALLRYAGGDPARRPALGAYDPRYDCELGCSKKPGRNEKWEFHDVHAERISLDEQVKMAGRTTIMLGVHGNGLTHLVLMRPTLVSAVVEMFIPGGFARDYEWTSRSLGMTHYSVWNNSSFTHPNEPAIPDYPDGFHGPNIPVDGAFVAALIEKHVASREKGEPRVENSPVYDAIHD
ncbi:hypothetical protein C8R46DRAFT_1110180 [Mycena filopes]|nr:hypothetical protein C8R46DRAFT_1110180 [Mycena filopes]